MRILLLLAALLAPAPVYSQIPAVVDANGQLIGNYIGPVQVAPQNEPRPQLGAFGVVSRTGYTFSIEPRSAAIGRAQEGVRPTPDGQSVDSRIYYQNSMCSGQGYAKIETVLDQNVSGHVRMRAVGGFVLTTGSTPGNSPFVYFVSKTAAAVPAASLNITHAAFCRNSDGTVCSCVGVGGIEPDDVFLQANPNDPAITGVPSEPWTGPATIEIVPMNAFLDLFCDGFEGHPICSGR